MVLVMFGCGNMFLSEFKQRLHDLYIQEWRIKVDETSQHRLYKHMKENFEFEPYLHMINKGVRVSVTKIRLSSHLFLIERGSAGGKPEG